jgi:hypothetical protein
MGSRLRLLFALLTVAGVSAAAATSAVPLPKLQTATVVGDRVNLTFTGPLKPRVGAWTVLVNGKLVAVTATFSGRRVQLRLPAGVYSDDVVRVVGRNLRSAKGIRLKAVGVTPANRSTPGCSEQLGTLVEGQPREGPTDHATFLRADRFRLYVVRIDFPDHPRPTPPPPFPAPPTMELSALDRDVRDLSYGRSSVTFARFEPNIRMLRNAADYAHSGPWSARRPLLQDVLAQIDPVVDFREYDGLVVEMSFDGPSATSPRPQLDPVAVAPPGQGIAVDGKELRHFLFGRSPSALLPPLLQLAGVPVLASGDVGAWDRMGAFGGRGLLAWHRRKLGWIGPSEVRCVRSAPLEVVLAPTWRGGGIKAVIAPTGPAAAIVLENRQRQGHDATACVRGILAYRVDTQAPTSPIRTLNPGRAQGSISCPSDVAPYDVAAGQTVRVTDARSFEVLAVEDDGSYRVRVSR